MSGIPSPVVDPNAAPADEVDPLAELPAVDDSDLGLDAEQLEYLNAFKSLNTPDATDDGTTDEPDPTLTDPAAPAPVVDPTAPVVDAPVVDPSAPAPAAPVTPVAPASISTAIQLGGNSYEPAVLERAIGLTTYFDGLPPDAIQAFDAILSGDYILVPRNQAQAPGAPPAVPAPVPGSIDDEWVDPKAAAEIARLNAQIAATNQNVNSLAQQDNQRRQQEFESMIDNASATFKTEHNLSDAQLARIQQAVVSAQVIPGLMRTTPGGPSAVYAKALDMIAWQDAEFRATKIEAARQVTTDAERQAHTERQARKAKAGAVASTGAPGARTAPATTPKTGDRQSLVQAMADMITQGSGEA